MLNVVFGSFSTPHRCCWPSLVIQGWGKEWSNCCLRVPFWSSFGEESECGGGHCLRYFDHKILLFYAEHGFWLFFTPNQVLLTIFSHSKVSKGVVNHASKVTFVIIFWSRIRMWWSTLFTILWSQIPFILCWTWFLAIFQPQAGPEKQHFPSRCSSLPTQLICIQA